MAKRCECPASGAYYCAFCANLAARAGLIVRSSPLEPTPPAVVAEATGAAFQNAIYTHALNNGWLLYHTYKSRKSTPGWPDVALCHPQGGQPLYLIEIKRKDEAVSAFQQRWLEALAKVTHVETGVWRPADWPRVQRLLAQHNQ